MSYSTKYPVLLPRDHVFTTLVIQDTHSREFHY